MKKIMAGMLIFASAVLLCGAEIKLTQNGKAVSSIILRKNASDTEKHAAKELAHFLAKISKGTAPAVGTSAVNGKYPVYLELTRDKRVKEEGFKITATEKALRIAGRTPVGVLYGVYEVLKKDAGIWWLEPGPDGEYFTVKPTITVKKGVRIQNPDFSMRNISGVCMNSNSITMDTWDWGVRNNMRFRTSYRRQVAKQMRERAIISKIGGHCYTTMMTGWVVDVPKGVKYRDHVNKLFKEHPEYFPLRNGKRQITYFMGNEPQPCTSNKEVIKRCAENIVRWMKRAKELTGGADVMIDFGSNDSTQWCECDKCNALDPADEKAKGRKATRNWIFTNEVAKEVQKKLPGQKLWGWSYANFTQVPTGVKLSKDVGGVMVSNHYRCWKHALDDKTCVTNGKYYNYNGSWDTMERPVYSYEELISAGRLFLPVEKEWASTMKYYAKNLKNFAGTVTEVCCPDGIYSSVFRKYENFNNWNMMWQAMYMGMAFHWDATQDIEKLYEKINSLYYGKGWAGGMREFRKYLHTLYMNAGGCWGFAHSTPVGKFLDVPGAKEKLEKYLASAEKAAAKDPDKRALAHVKKVKEYFERTWVKAYKDYISNFREIKAYPLKGKIVIDGKLDDADWKNADGVTRFKKAYSQNNELARYQTSVKMAYDSKNFYIGIECLEPDPANVRTNVKEFDGPVWNDNGVELFLNDPIMGGTYYQICINANGVYCDGVVAPGGSFNKSYQSNAEIKTSKGKDRYFIEVRIPASRLTGSDLLAGSMIRMNVFRTRVPLKGKKEFSTWSIGTPHNVDTFHAVNLAVQRSLNSNSKEVDARTWRNSSFNEVRKTNKMPKGWKTKSTKVPASWGFASAKGYQGSFEYLLHPGSSTNYYLHFARGGYIANSCKIKSPWIAASCRLRGKGTLYFTMLRYTAKWRMLPAKALHKISVDTKGKWQTFHFEFPRPGALDENHTVMVQIRDKATAFDMDDIYLVARDKPVMKQAKSKE